MLLYGNINTELQRMGKSLCDTHLHSMWTSGKAIWSSVPCDLFIYFLNFNSIWPPHCTTCMQEHTFSEILKFIKHHIICTCCNETSTKDCTICSFMTARLVFSFPLYVLCSEWSHHLFRNICCEEYLTKCDWSTSRVVVQNIHWDAVMQFRWSKSEVFWTIWLGSRWFHPN